MIQIKIFRKQYKRLLGLASACLSVFLFFQQANLAEAVTVSPPRLELRGDPGETINGEFKISPDGQAVDVYYTEVENFEAGDESGSPQFVKQKTGLALWTDVAPSIEIGRRDSVVVPFSIQIPFSAQPGGYFASIFVRTTPPPAQGGEVSIGARVGTLILLSVNGEVSEGVDILEFSTKQNKTFFESLPIEFYYRFRNIGDDRVAPKGNVTVKNILGMTSKKIDANFSKGSVLPNSTRKFNLAWQSGDTAQTSATLENLTFQPSGFLDAAKYQLSNFGLGRYTAVLDLEFGANSNHAVKKFSFYVFPWQLLSLIGGALLILAIVLKLFISRYNKYIISQHGKNK